LDKVKKYPFMNHLLKKLKFTEKKKADFVKKILQMNEFKAFMRDCNL